MLLLEDKLTKVIDTIDRLALIKFVTEYLKWQLLFPDVL